MIVYYVSNFGSVAASICLQGSVHRPVKLDPEESETQLQHHFYYVGTVYIANLQTITSERTVRSTHCIKTVLSDIYVSISGWKPCIKGDQG